MGMGYRETSGAMGQYGQEPAGKAGREGELIGKEPEAATGFLKLGKIPRKTGSDSRVP